MPLVDEQEVGHGVIRNKDVHPTVVIHVCRDGAKGFTGMIGYPGFFTDIGESAVPVVVKQIAGPGLVMARNAVVTPVDIISAQYVQRFVIVDKAGNKQVQFAVVVVIKPDRTSDQPTTPVPDFSVTSVKVAFPLLRYRMLRP